MCKLVLEHYRFIKEMSELSAAEFRDFVFGISPAAYSAFKNKGIESVRNIIAAYVTIIEKCLQAMKDKYKNSQDLKRKEIRVNNDIIRLLYINKKRLTVRQIAIKAGINESHFCRYHVRALEYFAEIFKVTAKRLGYGNTFINKDVRVIELMRLHNIAQNIQKIA